MIEERDVAVSIYEVPLTFRKEKLDRLILSLLSLRKEEKDLVEWEKIVGKLRNPERTVTVAVAGKYTQLKDAYKSIWEALTHGGIANNAKVRIKYVDVEKENLEEELKQVNGILVPGGFGERGIEGKINAVRYARENKIPFLGICLGMQCAVIEFARNVCRMKGANSTEFSPETPYPVIDLLAGQRRISQKGGTMRLGSYPCEIKNGSLAYLAYKRNLIAERHRHRYELNNKFRKTLESYGLVVTGEYKKKGLAEIVELKSHPWFVAVQFHPEFKSRPLNAHPLFREFIKSAIKFKI